MAETTTTDPYPEHAKQAAVLDESQAIGCFLDEGPYVLAEFREVEGYRDPQLVPTTKTVQQVLADWLGIDLDEIEREKRRMLESIREMNDRADEGGRP